MRLDRERVIIAALFSARDPDPAARIAALTAHLERAGATVVATVVQRRGVSRSHRAGGARRMEQPLSAQTVLGHGKAAELALACRQHGVSVVVFLNTLTRGQRAHLTAMCEARVYEAAELS
jgi:50S ribosomal subunit-associated GTPase HflX